MMFKRSRWYSAIPYALLMPFYWLLQCAAGYMALYQFIFRPFYWEKTNHNAYTDYRLDELQRGEQPLDFLSREKMP